MVLENLTTSIISFLVVYRIKRLTVASYLELLHTKRVASDDQNQP